MSSSRLRSESCKRCGIASRHLPATRAGPAKALPYPLLGYAPHIFSYLDVISLHGVDNAPSKMESLPVFFTVFSERHVSDTNHAMIRKILKRPQLV